MPLRWFICTRPPHWLYAAVLPWLAVLAFVACGGGTIGGAPDETGEGNIGTFSKSYGGPLHDAASVVLETDDGGFMLLGSAEGGGLIDDQMFPKEQWGMPRAGDFWLQKLDANGNVENNLTIGRHSASQANTTWERARPTADGGAVLVGKHDVTEVVRRPPDNDPTDQVVSADVAIAKVDANGDTLWSVTLDSGGWDNYAYFQRGADRPAARDAAKDVWEMEDGGFLVAATSFAHLEDTSDIGFPCDDEELNEIGEEDVGHSQCDGVEPNGPFRFIDAMSVVVMRINADGTLRWVRRLYDNPYDTDNNSRSIALTIRGTRDDGAVLSRLVGFKSVLVRRLDADGAPLWRRTVYGVAPVMLPQDLIETRDGFAVAGRERVVQLNTDGSVRWNKDFTIPGSREENPDVKIYALAEHCNDFDVCRVVAAGEIQRWVQPPGQSVMAVRSAFVAFLGEDGDLDVSHLAPLVDGRPMFMSWRRMAISLNSIDLLGETADGIGKIRATGIPAAANFGSQRALLEATRADKIELRDSSAQVVLAEEGPKLQFRDAAGGIVFSTTLDPAYPNTEVLRAAAHMGSGRFLIAGTQRAPDGQSGVVLMRYDYGQGAPRVVWQRTLLSAHSDVTDMVPSGDGGAVLAVSYAAGMAEPRGLLLKLDADGDRRWRVELDAPPIQVQRMSDGGFAALTRVPDALDTKVTRFSAAGEFMWHNSVTLPAAVHRKVPQEKPESAMVATSDGGLVIATTDGALIDLVRLAPDGSLQLAGQIRPAIDSRTPSSLKDLHIAQAADGGFVLAMTEQGMLNRLAELPGEDPDLLPVGQGNIFVHKVDASFVTVWSHVYGALLDEGVNDLAVRSDGTIAIAGYSDSMGELRDAWLLKLSPHGMISDGGCRALLAILPVHFSSTRPLAAEVTPTAFDPGERVSLPDFVELQSPQRTPTDYETARQCIGDARAGRPVVQIQRRLTVAQTGNLTRAVTSLPSGISCGTGANLCSADFVNGTVVTLRADRDRFVRWVTACEGDTGGSNLTCTVTMDRDRTIEVDFSAPPPPPPPGPTFHLEFTVHNRGFVSTDTGITCTESDTVATCSQDLPVGTVVNARAVPDSGLTLFTWGEGDPLCRSFGIDRQVTFTMDRNVRCQVQFSTVTPGLRFDLDVNGMGTVRDEARPNDFDCRDLDFDNKCTVFLPAGTSMALRITPDDGWHFAGWGGDCANFTNPAQSFNLNENMACVATFHPDVARLTVLLDNATDGRVVTSQPAGIECTSDPTSDCMEDFPPNLRITLRASPAGFRGWQGCDRVIDVNYCEVDMTQPRTVTAQFNP